MLENMAGFIRWQDRNLLKVPDAGAAERATGSGREPHPRLGARESAIINEVFADEAGALPFQIGNPALTV